jgi:hypothetical protein
VAKHALDGQMRLAGICGAEHGGDAAVAILIIVGEEITHVYDLGPDPEELEKRRKSAFERYKLMFALTNGTIPERT